MPARALVFLALIASASAAGAQDTAPAEQPKEKKICRLVTPTGSVVPKRICLTSEEWKRLNDQWAPQNSAFQKVQNRSAVNPNP